MRRWNLNEIRMVFVTPTVHMTPETVTWGHMIDLSRTDLSHGGAAALALPAACVAGQVRQQ